MFIKVLVELVVISLIGIALGMILKTVAFLISNETALVNIIKNNTEYVNTMTKRNEIYDEPCTVFVLPKSKMKDVEVVLND